MAEQTDDIGARMDAYQAKCSAAAEAIAEVLLDPECTSYPPDRSRLHDALDVLDLETTCGDCLELQCHGAGEDECGCARHDASVEARDRARRLRAAGVILVEGSA